MSDDPMFDYVLARSRARETSILAIATIASSASVVLFSLYFEKHIALNLGIAILGIIFAGLGLGYREVTARTIHRNDEDWLNDYVRMWISEHLDALSSRLIFPRSNVRNRHLVENPLGYFRGQLLRQFIIRLLFVIPIIAWMTVINVYAGGLALAISCFYTVTLTCAE